MKVWIEHDYCTGDGLCEDLCPEMFEMRDDALAHVRGDFAPATGGSLGSEVPEALQDSVLDAQAQCAGECIYVRND